MPRRSKKSKAASAWRLKKAKDLQAGWIDDKLAETFEGESLNHDKKAEESKMLLILASDVQKLEKYLSSEMEKLSAKLEQHPSCSACFNLSVLTVAKIILFNKPRANREVQLTVASFKDKSTKLDPADETVQCLSSVEKKLCERLHIVKTVTKEGKTSPILVTPCTKKAMELLVEKWPNLINGILRSNTRMKVLDTVVENVQLENPGLLQDARLQKHVAFISQVIAMHDKELDWLTSHIANSFATEEDLHNPQISAVEMAKVLQFLRGIDCGPPQVCTDETVSLLQLPATTASMTEYTEEPKEEKYSDVLRRANISESTRISNPPLSGLPDIAEDETEDQEEEVSVITISVNELQEEDQSVMRISVDLPCKTDDEPAEEKYSYVLRRENELQEEDQSVMRTGVDLPYKTEDIHEPAEEKYSDVLKRNKTLTASTDVEGSLDVINSAESINRQHSNRKRHYWKVTENDRNRSKSKVRKKDGKRHKSKNKRWLWSKQEVDAIKATLGSYIATKRVPHKLLIIMAQEQRPILRQRKWKDIRRIIKHTIKNKGFLDHR